MAEVEAVCGSREGSIRLVERRMPITQPRCVFRCIIVVIAATAVPEGRNDLPCLQ